jgi:tRNA threonylcarbamoyl adenosine modification protein (Sua5/YciO/YrdC/YwlC family)
LGEHLFTYDNPPAERDVRRTVAILEKDGVIAYPTDLNWAFGCDAASPKAIDRIYRLKPSHPKDRPFSLICSSISQAAEYVNIGNAEYRILKKAWPGPYTVLLTATRSFPRQLKDKRRVVGIRIPDCNLIRAIVDALGRPLATTSVPPIREAGEDEETGDEIPIYPRFGYEVEEIYGHAVDLILDLGSEHPGIESTVVDMTEGYPQIVRVGAGDPKLFESAVPEAE